MPRVAPATTTGCLVSEAGAPVPLLGVSARAEIRDYACRVVLSQRFRNDESQPIEAVYKFPLDESSAVCGFEAEIDGRIVKGKVEEREKAFAAYDDALQQGHGAYLLDEEHADVFTVSVGNLPPGKEAVLRLTTVSELPLEGDAIRFTLPTTIAPRYAPAEDRTGVGESEADRVTPPYALDVPYGLALEVDVQTTAPVRSVESPSHPVSVTIDEGRATVRLSAREAALDRDVVLKIVLAETHAPRAVVERAPDGKSYALVSFRPKLETALAPAEVIFLVDRSGSMQGTSIAEARNALQLALRSLSSGCRFNIVGFGDTYKALFRQSRPYDDASLAEATRHVKAIDADLGGTEILRALRHVLEAKPLEGLPRQLFVLTDGEVSNTDAVIELARRHAGHVRIFTFGVGAGASHHLVKGLARAGDGEAEFIAPGERIEAKVMRQLQRALAPALSDVRVDWSGLQATQAPHEVPPVFSDGRVLLFARLDKAEPATVTLQAVAKGGAVSFALPLDPGAATEGTLVGTLWARHAIRDLEEGRSELHPRRGSQQARAGGLQDEKVKAAIVSLGKEWSLVSRHTSFVAVEDRETPTEGEAQLRKVPVMISDGWHGIRQQLGAGLVGGSQSPMARGAAMALTCSPAASAHASDILRSIVDRYRSRLQRPDDEEAILEEAGGDGDDCAVQDAAMPFENRVSASVRPLDRLVALQAADGSWALDDEFARALGWRDRKQLLRAASREPNDATEASALATALALNWLAEEQAGERGEWAMLAEKGRQWLASRGLDAWLAVAHEALSRR